MRNRRPLARRSAETAVRPQTNGAVVESSQEVSIDEFLARRRVIPHLSDVTARMDTPGTTWGPDSPTPDIAPIAAAVRKKGPHTDIRLLVGDGENHSAVVSKLADTLWCDVYVTPNGADLRFVKESSSVGGTTWDAVAFDRESGQPVEWLVVRPTGMPDDAPTWFVSSRGRLRQRGGLVTMPFPGGLAFATKSTFRDTVHVSTRMREPTSRLTAVMVNADLGQFEISRFDGGQSLLGGVEFATLVAASLDLIHPDVQLGFTWPTDEPTCKALEAELIRFADALNRTVWVPEPAGSVFVVVGSGELAAVDEVGSPSTWRAYPSRLNTDRTSPYVTDADGRLVPEGEIAVVTFPGIPLVSVPAVQLDQLRPWYESVPPIDGLFAVDLAVLGDGRLGLCRSDGSPVAVGPRQLRTELRDAGWMGQDLLLLTQPPAEYWDAAVAHAGHIVKALKVDLWLPALGAQVWVGAEGLLAAQGADDSELAWHGVHYVRPGDAGESGMGPLPPALSGRAPRRHEREAAGWSDADRSPEDAVPHEVASAALDAAPVVAVAHSADEEPHEAAPTASAAVVPRSVVAGQVATSGVPHGVSWLPVSPVVTSRPSQLYLWTAREPDRIDEWGLPSPDVFLLACQDPLRVADRKRAGNLLRVAVPAQAAIDLLDHISHIPDNLKRRINELGSTHLVPMAWLAGVKVTARYELDGEGGIAAGREVDHHALAVCFEGADHGVPGLPNEVVQWPDRRLRGDAPTYLVLPEDPALVAAHRKAHHGFLPLSRRRPKVTDGQHLLEVRIRRRGAIDVPATLDKLSALPVTGRLHDFVGKDLLLSEHEFPHAVVTKVWRTGERRRSLDKITGGTLADALATDAFDQLAGLRS